VVTSNPERAEQVRSRYPEATIHRDADELFGDPGSHDVVVVAAPNRAHFTLGMATIEAGLHLVVDKPLAATVEEGERLAAVAAESGVVASVFHNRRWDGDFLTLRRLVADGTLGDVVRLESRFERWRPQVDAGKWREGGTPEDAGGLLFDLGPHLIDQALELFGPARSVYADVRTLRPGAQVDDDFLVVLEHESDATSRLSATMLAAQVGPRFRALGSRAAYVKWGLDVQEDALRDGRGPADAGFGDEPPEAWGRVGSDEASEPVETERGRYVKFYEGLERAIREREATRAASGEAALAAPVPLEAGVATLRVIQAARESSAQRAVVSL
jgi:predicted dehydrogenase